MIPLKSKGEIILFRRDWRAAMRGRGFLGRNGRPNWTPKRKVTNDRSK
jgi:hypothetical protein